MHRRRLVSVLDDDGLRGDLKPHLLERFSFHPPGTSEVGALFPPKRTTRPRPLSKAIEAY
jgi:hypothetical protein